MMTMTRVPVSVATALEMTPARLRKGSLCLLMPLLLLTLLAPALLLPQQQAVSAGLAGRPFARRCPIALAYWRYLQLSRPVSFLLLTRFAASATAHEPLHGLKASD